MASEVKVMIDGKELGTWEGNNSQDGALFSPTPGSIEVYPSGVFVDLLDPKPETIFLEDIAHHLSMCCRYAGGIREFYSVAEHSVLVHDLIPHIVSPVKAPIHCVELQKAALLHDGAESYTGDMTAPLKWLMRQQTPMLGSTFDLIADRLDEVIGQRFGIDPLLFNDPVVKMADLWAMKIEAKKLTKTGGANWRFNGDLPNNGNTPVGLDFVGGLRTTYARARFWGRVCKYGWPVHSLKAGA